MPLTPDTVERMKQETIAALRKATQSHIDTGKVKQMLSESEQRVLQQIAPVYQRLDEHDNAFVELGRSFSKGFGAITATVGRLTGKKS